MPNYNESPVAGTQWQRCSEIIISNPLNAAPRVVMREERVVAIDGGATSTNELPLNLFFDFDPGAQFPILNPATDSPTGATITAQEIYSIIYSVYRAKAGERDASGS